MMLSRIAESLFWIGRYVERAADTSRILDVHLNAQVEDQSVGAEAASYSLFATMGIDPAQLHGADDPNRVVMDEFCYSTTSPASVVSAIAAGRESARRARETLSVELWESINTSHHAFSSSRFRSLRPQVAFREVRERCAVILGTADQTMIHDEGWHFVALGTALERVDMTARLVSLASVNPNSTAGWSNALRACGAHHAYIRAFGGNAVGAESAAFLLLHHQFPRSIVYNLQQAEDSLRELHGRRRTMLVEDPASLLLGRARSDLEYRASSALLVDLHQRMEQLQEACAHASSAISQRYFEGANADQWFGGLQ